MSTQPEQAAQRAAIRPVKESVEDELIARPGVVAVDIAEKETDGKKTGELSIVVFVEQKKPTSKLAKGAAIPKEIDGIKTDVQELVIELQPAMRQVEDTELHVDPADYPTLAGGISIGPRRSVALAPPDVPAPGNFVFVGTLGANLLVDPATAKAVLEQVDPRVLIPAGDDAVARQQLVESLGLVPEDGGEGVKLEERDLPVETMRLIQLPPKA